MTQKQQFKRYFCTNLLFQFLVFSATLGATLVTQARHVAAKDRATKRGPGADTETQDMGRKAKFYNDPRQSQGSTLERAI